MAGGTGTWSVTASNWSLSNTGDASLSVWPGTGYNAEFLAGTGTVTLDAVNTISASNIAFDANTAYTLSGGTLALTGGSITANANATIGSVITGPVALTKLGTGTLYLTGSNTYTGNTYVDGGVLNFNTNTLSLSSTTNNKIYVNSGGTLQWATGNVQDISLNLGTLVATRDGHLRHQREQRHLRQHHCAWLSNAGADSLLVKTGSGTLTMPNTTVSVGPGYAAANLSMTAGTLAFQSLPFNRRWRYVHAERRFSKRPLRHPCWPQRRPTRPQTPTPLPTAR